MIPLWALLALYLAGVIMYWLKRADYAVKNKTTSIGSRSEWLAYYSVSISFRVFLELIIFFAWALYPGSMFSFLDQYVGHPVRLQLNIVTAPLVGLFVDVLLDWFLGYMGKKVPFLSFLAKEVPVINGGATLATPPDDKSNAAGAGGN